MRRLASAFLASVTAVCFLAAPVAAQDASPETRSTWVLQDRFATPAESEATMARLADAGFNLVLARVWYGGATVYPSDVVERAGGPRQQAQFTGRDPLADLILAGRRHGVRVGAWMEYGLAERITSAGGPGPILTAHPEWRMVGRDGLDYVAHSTGQRSYWMEPSVPAVRAFIRDLHAEVAGRYPDLAVVEFDRFRYPSLDFSYSPVAIAAYRAETGQGDPMQQELAYGPWVQWRRSVITRMTGEAYRAVKAANPNTVVSAAVVPPYMIDTSQDKLQHWPTWADSGYVDALDPMFYGTNSAYATWTIQAKNWVGTKISLYPGGQVSGNDVRDLVATQRSQKTGGITFWYEADLGAAELTSLRTGPFATRVLPEFDDRRADDSDASFALTGNWTTVPAGDRGSRRLAAGEAGEARWKVQTRHAGDYDVYLRWPADPELTREASIAVSTVGSPAAPAVFSFDQSTRGGTWVRVGTVRVGSGASVSPPVIQMSLVGSGAISGITGGAVAGRAFAADGVRLVRVQPMRVEEVLVEDARTILVRLTYPVGTVAPADFAIDGVPVAAVSVEAASPRLVRITTGADLTEGASYVLRATLRSTEGYATVPSDGVAFTRSAAATVVVDDGATGFVQSGAWTVAAGGYGSGMRTAPASASAIWNTRLDGGRYVAEVYVPAPVAGGAAAQAYQIGHIGGFANVTLSTSASGWQSLGAYEYETGASALIRLTAAAGQTGTLVADAVRWRRTLGTTTAAPETPSETASILTVGPNPASDVVRVRYAVPVGAAAQLTIFDALGRSVDSRAALTGSLDESIGVSHLAAGLYIVRLTVTGGSAAATTVQRSFVRRP